MIEQLNSFAEKLSQNFSDFIKRNYIVFLLTFVAGIIVYSFDIFNHFLTIDEEYVYQYRYEAMGQLIILERWSLWLLNKLLIFDYPPVSQLLGLFFFSLSAVVILDIKDIRSSFTFVAKIIFGILFISFPIYLHIELFSHLASSVGLGTFLVSFAGSRYSVSEMNFKSASIIVLLILFSLGIYQSLIAIFITIVIFKGMIGYAYKRDNLIFIFKNIIIAVGLSVVAVIIHYLIIYIFLGINDSGSYVNTRIGWLGDIWSSFRGVLTNTYRLLVGIRGFPNIMPIASIFILLVALRFAVKQKKDKGVSFGIMLLLTMLFFFASISFNIAVLRFLPFRTQVSLHIFFAGIIVLYYMLGGKFERFILVIITLILFVYNSNQSSRILMSDYYVRKADEMVAIRVLNKIYDIAPSSAAYSGKIPLAFVGVYNQKMATPLVIKNDVFGASFWSWDNGVAGRILPFLYSLGMSTNIVSVNEEQFLNASAYAKDNMKTYPEDGFVKIKDGIIIIKMGEID